MSAPALVPLGVRATQPRKEPTFLARWITRVLAFPLVGKLAGANILVVVAALGAMVAMHGSGPEDREVLAILGMSLAGSLALNLVLVGLALRPLRALETTAAQVRRGDLDARVVATPLADRTVRRVGDAINLL